MTPEQQKAIAHHDSGMTYRQVGAAMGIHTDAARALIRRGRAHKEADPAAIKAAEVAGSHAIPHSFWVKTDTHSIYYKTPPSAQTNIDVIRDAFSDLPTAQLSLAEPVGLDQTLTLYPLADIHLGMRAWGDETGAGDYDTDLARQRVQAGMNRLVAASPASAEAIIVAIGDSLHANDNSNMTPQSKHVLDVDTRMYRTIDVAIAMFAAAVDLAAQKHARVTFCILPGNHDRDSYLAILFAMRERYRDIGRIVIVASPMEFFVHEFGFNMLAFHHGDKAKASRLVMDAADRWPHMWGRTRHRHYYTGHLHHHKSEDIGGMQWEQLRAVSAKDAYAASHAYSARSQMQAITFHIKDGEVSRCKVKL